MAEAEGLHAQVTGDASGFSAALSNATGALGGFRGAIGGAVAGLAAFAGAKGIGAAVSAAVKFERQVADLAKLVGEEQAEPLSRSVQNLAETLPIATDALFEAAEGAARLGVRGTANITRFTEVMGKIELATDATAEQAATSMARIAKVTETPISQVNNLASAMNEASNTMAVSFSEVLDAAQRAAPGLAQLGASSDEVVTLSAAVAELSANASRSGTRLNRLGSVLLEGGDTAETFARSLQISGEEFRNLRDDDPTELILELARVMRRGGDAAQLLNNELDQTSLRILRTLARNVDQTTQRVDDMNRAFEEGASLNEEYARFASTAAAQTQRIENQMQNLQTSIGEELLPVWKELLEVTQFWIQLLPDRSPLALSLPEEDVQRFDEVLRRAVQNSELTADAWDRIPRNAREFAAQMQDAQLQTGFLQATESLVEQVAEGEMTAREFSRAWEQVTRTFLRADPAAEDAGSAFERMNNAVDEFVVLGATTENQADRLRSTIANLAGAVPTENLDSFSRAAGNLITSFDPATDSVAHLVRELRNMARDAGATESAIRGIGSSADGASDSMDNLNESMRDFAAEADERHMRRLMREWRSDMEDVRAVDTDLARQTGGADLTNIFDSDSQQSLQEMLGMTLTLKDAARDMATSFTDAFASIVSGSEGAGDAFADLIDSLLQDLARLAAQQFLLSLLTDVFGASAGGGGGSAGSGTGSAGFMGGFQHGGSFVVPGSGGPDSQLVAFRATPGERVDVSRRGEGGGRPVQVNQTVNFSVSAIDGRDAARFVREQKGQIASVVAEASRESQGFRHRVLTGQ